MPTRDRARDRGLRRSRQLRSLFAAELRDARLMAGVSQRHLARVSGLTQSTISRTERGERTVLTIDEAAILCAGLGLRLSLKTYPDGSPVRDAAQLRLLASLRGLISEAWQWHPEALVGAPGDQRAWDVLLTGPSRVGVDAETHIHDVQALQRRIALKQRDSGVAVAILLVSGSRHNRRVIREHRSTLRATFPLQTDEVLLALKGGLAPDGNGIVVLPRVGRTSRSA